MRRIRPARQLPRSYRALATFLRGLMQVLTKRDWRGAENFPSTGGFVVSPNHVSYFDPLAFSHFLYDNGHPPFFLAKDALFRIPLIGRLLTAAQQIPVYRGGGQAADAFQAAVEAIEDGKCVPIYPEGTLTRDPGLWPMTGKTGAARVALTTQCPLVPVAQWGPQDVLVPYGKIPKLFPRKTMHLRAGAPVELSDLYGRPLDETLHEASDRLMAAITALLEEIRGAKAPAERFDPRRAGVAETGNPRKGRRPSALRRPPSGDRTIGGSGAEQPTGEAS